MADQLAGVTAQADNTLSFPVTTATLFRATDACTNPTYAFLPGDAYGLVVNGGGPVRTGLSLAFAGNTVGDQDDVFDVGPVIVLASENDVPTDYGQQGTTQADASVSFTWDQGSNPSTVDATPVVTATARLGALPTQEGELMDFDVTIGFMDGGVVHVVIVEPVGTFQSGCPAG